VSNSSDENEPSTQSSQVSRASLPNLKGRDLFDSMVWADAFTTSIHYMFISSLRQRVLEVKETTETHKFIKVLRDGGRLVRNYTQNIDLLEEREGLVTELSSGPGNRSRFFPKTQREPRPAEISGDSPHCGGVEVVLLHGSLGRLRCGICSRLSEWDEERGTATIQGRAPDCPSCTEANANRTGKGRRGVAIGRLRPDIVLYGEEHPHSTLVSDLVTHDLGLGPDVMLIMGTSLKVHGLKIMIKEFAKAIHIKGGKVVFVNRTKPSESAWGDVIDYWVEWDCDEWVGDLKRRRGDIWLPQGSVQERRESVGDAKSKKVVESTPGESTQRKKKYEAPRCTRDCRVSGAYITFKILDTLRSLEDNNGPSTRRQYWVPTRQSQGAKIPPSKKTSATLPKFGMDGASDPLPVKKTQRKSLPAVRPQSTKMVPTSNKRKSMQAPAISEDKLSVNIEMVKQATWQNLRDRFPSLSERPPDFSHSILQERCANNPTTAQQFAREEKSYLPNLAGVGWSAFPTIVTHPPHGWTPPAALHTIQKPILPPTRPPPTHSYGTRAAQIQLPPVDKVSPSKSLHFNAAFTALDMNISKENRIPTPPKSDPQTPVRRSSDMSIGALLSLDDEQESAKTESSSGSEVFHDAVETAEWHDTVEVMEH